MAKPKMSVSESKRELAMQSRGTGKKVGAKATAQRIAAKRFGKTAKKQEVAASKRGGTKPASKAKKSGGASKSSYMM